jgi:hypothetical protein
VGARRPHPGLAPGRQPHICCVLDPLIPSRCGGDEPSCSWQSGAF